MADKPVINYDLRRTVNPRTGENVFYPVVVDRDKTVSLAQVVEDAIDRSLIVGVKPEAAESIARGVAAELYHQFQLGKGIAFGKYFYGRLYLDGTVPEGGTVSVMNNGINVRLIKGEDFKLSYNDFSYHKVGGDGAALTYFGSQGGYADGELAKSQPFFALGKGLTADEGGSVAFTVSWLGEEETVSVPVTPTKLGAEQAVFAWPSTLDTAAVGTEVTLRCVKKNADGDVTATLERKAKLIAA